MKSLLIAHVRRRDSFGFKVEFLCVRCTCFPKTFGHLRGTGRGNGATSNCAPPSKLLSANVRRSSNLSPIRALIRRWRFDWRATLPNPETISLKTSSRFVPATGNLNGKRIRREPPPTFVLRRDNANRSVTKELRANSIHVFCRLRPNHCETSFIVRYFIMC